MTYNYSTVRLLKANCIIITPSYYLYRQLRPLALSLFYWNVERLRPQK
jgi:hypothetical protein